MTMTRIPPVACALCVVAAIVSIVHAAPPATRPAATTRSTTRATTTFTITATPNEKVEAELERIWADVLPKEVRDGNKDPTDEQKFLLRTAFTMSVIAQATPERVQEAEKNRQAAREAVEQFFKQQEDARKSVKNDPAEIRAEMERQLASTAEVLRLFNQITDGPATPGATQEQVERRALEILRDLPTNLRALIKAGVEAKYRGSRLNLLQQIRALEKDVQAAKDGATRHTLEGRIAALSDLVRARDATYQAERRLIEVTPLGQLDDVEVPAK
jgi:hypothetical protein